MTSPPAPTAPLPSRTYRGESAEGRREQRRQRLMEAAFACFARKGIVATTMRDICAEAGLTDRYFYEAFRNTGDAFDAVHDWQREQLITVVTAAMMGADKQIQPLARAGLHAFYAFVEADRRRAQVLLIDAFSANRQAAEKGQRAINEYTSLIASFALTIYRRLDPCINMRMLMGGLLSMAIEVGAVWARNGYRESIEEVIGYNMYAWEGLEARMKRSISRTRAR